MKTAIALAAALAATTAAAQVRVLYPSDAPFARNPLGIEAARPLAPAGPNDRYVFIVRFAKGERAALHVHPDDRVMTVIKGTLTLGAADGSVRDVPAGTVLLMPANTPHSGWAKKGPVEIVETGTGLSGTTLVTKP